MKNETQFHHIADSDLDQASGGMDCSTALAVSRAYVAAAGVMSGLGNAVMTSYFAGKASGVMEAGCPK